MSFLHALARTLARRIFKGISWRNPVINTALHILNPLDYVVRASRGLSHLPCYSARVRSNGLPHQFGGRRFYDGGTYLVQLLQEHAQLSPSCDVLDIGCGCGRIAVFLAKIFEDGSYTGMEIDEISLRSCMSNSVFSGKNFRFDLMDLYNGVYNPQGKQSDANYVFPYPDESFDIIFLFSVFTHMLPAGVSNYIKETSRMLKPGGRYLATTFLMDYGKRGDYISFHHDHGDYCLLSESIPEKAVGYYLDFFDETFSSNGMKRLSEPLIGPWRDSTAEVEPTIKHPQDTLVYAK